MPVVISLQVGRPIEYLHQGHADGNPSSWTTAFFKMPIAGPVQIGPLGLAGDDQADKENHGGPDKAVLAYSADHYPFWRQHVGLPDMHHGGFGENLTISESDETTVCIGDTWRAGEILFQVSQPRQPCWKMSRRWQVADLAKQVIANGRSGWYLRVLAEGELSPATPIALVSRPHPNWTVARASDLFHHHKNDLVAAAELAALPELSVAWKTSLARRIAKRQAADKQPGKLQ